MPSKSQPDGHACMQCKEKTILTQITIMKNNISNVCGGLRHLSFSLLASSNLFLVLPDITQIRNFSSVVKYGEVT